MIEIELTPKTLFGISLANMLKRPVWKHLREDTLKQDNYSCIVCGYKGKRLQCDEVWSYNSSKRLATLNCMRTLCYYCHSAKHYFHTRMIKNIDIDIIDDHIMRLNNWDKSQLNLHISRAYIKYLGYSDLHFKVDWKNYEKIIKDNVRYR